LNAIGGKLRTLYCENKGPVWAVSVVALDRFFLKLQHMCASNDVSLTVTGQ